ncbi:TnsA endonuclease N-terminal domain-containing protein [Yersinia sp. 2544 StPb PI]
MKALQEGVGVGSGEFYRPWLRPQDFTSSKGNRSAIRGLKTFRQHNMMSGVETDFFYLAEFNDAVIDIREQFPLFPLTLTQNLARILKVLHPAIRRKAGESETSTVPAVMTTDFVLTFQNPDGSVRYQAYSIKPDEVITKRNGEKQEIERLFWEGINVRFQLFTGSEATQTKSKNISWITSPFRMNGLPDYHPAPTLLALFPPGEYALIHMIRKIASVTGLADEVSLDALKLMIATKNIEVDMTYNIPATQVVIVLSNSVCKMGGANENY